MNVSIRKVADSSKHSDERLILDVLEDTDIGEYAVLDTTYTPSNSVSNKVRHCYWFPDKKVKKGDLVVLYTNPGTNTIQKNKDGSTTHFFHWGLKVSVWNNTGDCAVVLHISDWIHGAVV